MKKLPVLILLLCAATTPAADQKNIPSLPTALSGNAVAVLENGLEIVSLMGVGPKRTWDDVTNKVYTLSLAHPKWREARTVPGVAGRVNASAVAAKSLVILMGGFVVDNQGAELTLPDVNVYEGSARRWSRGKDIPVAVDGAVAGVTHSRYVYLIGGRSRNGPVNNVQVYDLEKDSWTQATPFPGTPVFGLSGGVADETIVVVDGAKAGPAGGAKYVASDECWLGKIDHKDPNKIEWSKLPAHPGTARFGIAGGGSNREHKILFSGGTAHIPRLQRRSLRRRTHGSIRRNLRLRCTPPSVGNHQRRYLRPASRQPRYNLHPNRTAGCGRDGKESSRHRGSDPVAAEVRLRPGWRQHKCFHLSKAALSRYNPLSSLWGPCASI